MYCSSLLFLTIFTTSLALNFTNPMPGTTISTRHDLHVSWITTSSDAKFVDFLLVNNNSTGLDQLTLAMNVSTAALRYTVQPSTFANLASFGSDFYIVANSIGSESNTFVGESGTFTISNTTTGSAGSGSATVSSASPSVTASSGADKTGSALRSLGLMVAAMLELIV